MGESEEQSEGNINRFLFEKSLVMKYIVTVLITNTGALVEYTKASGRQQLKELGNKN